MQQNIRAALSTLQEALKQHHLWQAAPPKAAALASTQPFCLDTLSATEWLQWIFIPRMHALLEAKAPLPKEIAITPYLEEALKHETYLNDLLAAITTLEQQIKQAAQS